MIDAKTMLVYWENRHPKIYPRFTPLCLGTHSTQTRLLMEWYQWNLDYTIWASQKSGSMSSTESGLSLRPAQDLFAPLHTAPVRQHVVTLLWGMLLIVTYNVRTSELPLPHHGMAGRHVPSPIRGVLNCFKLNAYSSRDGSRHNKRVTIPSVPSNLWIAKL